MNNESADISTQKKVTGNRGLWMGVFCIGGIGYELLFEFFKNFQNFFMTDICNISTGVVATVIIIVNICKAFFTPISGVLVDKNIFKGKDKHTPWLRIMPVVEGALFIAMAYVAWKGGSTAAIIAIFCVFWFLPVCLWSGFKSAIPSISMNSKESTFLASGVELCGTIGRLLTGIIVPVIMVKMSADGRTEDAQGFFWAVVISVVLTIIVYWISSLGLKKSIRPDQMSESKSSDKKETASIAQIFKQVFTDKNILIPFIVSLAICFRVFVVDPIAPYYFKYITGDMLQYATFSTTTNIAAILGTIVTPIILSTIIKDTRTLCAGAIVMQILCHLSLLFVGGSTVWFVVMMTICKFFYQMASLLIVTMFVNAIDVSELRARKAGKGKVASGTVMSLNFTAVMIAQIFASYIRNFALAQAGYVGAGTVASAQLANGLIKLFALWPSAFLVIGLVACMFYKLTPKAMEAFHSELDPLRAQDAEAATK